DIGFTGAEAEDVLALGLQVVGLLGYGDGRGWFDGGKAVGEESHWSGPCIMVREKRAAARVSGRPETTPPFGFRQDAL
ncbi:MAG: hypothetical protein RLO49_15910, partial [Rhodospirillales bacterium]